MQTTLRLETTVLPGHRLEISAPELPEGAKVDVIVVLPEKPKRQSMSMLQFPESLPPGPRAFPTWEERHWRAGWGVPPGVLADPLGFGP